jgi:hypothetical protein
MNKVIGEETIDSICNKAKGDAGKWISFEEWNAFKKWMDEHPYSLKYL